ncbi:phosphotransferase [Mycolicibacterium sp.]|uniref:DUF7064 domain-containing protein n=1 Tax=Mycolicibacterium sp. TaxID=2320850 RepID=UPI003D0A0207
MVRSPDLVIARPADLRADWLTDAHGHGAVTGFSAQRIGTGQMSECYRITLSYADGAAPGPASVVLKVAAADPSSRQTGLALGLYEREVRFYTEIAPRLAGPVAHCYHGAYDPQTGDFDLLLADAVPAAVGDELVGASAEAALLAVTELGRMQGPLLGSDGPADADWLNRESPMDQGLLEQLWAGFSERYGTAIAAEHRLVCERLVAAFDSYVAAESAPERPRGLVHGDYRLDNLLFGEAGAERRLTAVDWQTVTWGAAFTDAAYFLGGALEIEVRRKNYDALLRAYHQALGRAVTLDDVRDGVRRQSFFGVMMAIVSSMLVERTDRGDEMFMTLLRRHCSHVLDTDALAVLPAAGTPEPLRPGVDDEAAHPPGLEELWSESWYFDFADAGQGVGGWIRLGLVPNQDTAWINVLLCGPDMPTLAIVDFAAPLPTDPADVRTDEVHLTLRPYEPLREYRVTVHGRGEIHDDPAALLTGTSGRPIDLALDLTWTTAATPYAYRITSRYEIACSVGGSVIADGRRYDLSGTPGQRDHSWGVRDWWAMDWVWSALHLDDGTHLHGVDLRIPGAPPMGVGYLQPAGRPLSELTTVTARSVFADNGLPVTATLSVQPTGLTVDADIRGHAPVRLTARDGRVSLFPRAWAAVTTSDGRSGIGWLEWNRNAH